MHIHVRLIDPYGHRMIAKLAKNDNGELYWQRSINWGNIDPIADVTTKTPFIGRGKNSDLFTIFSDQPFNEEEFKEAMYANTTGSTTIN